MSKDQKDSFEKNIYASEKCKKIKEKNPKTNKKNPPNSTVYDMQSKTTIWITVVFNRRAKIKNKNYTKLLELWHN